VTSANLFTTRATASSQTAVSANPDSAGQTAGQALYQQARQCPQPEAMVKRQFEQRNHSQKTQLANEFIASAGREGIDRLAATPDGQHALAVVYDHARGEGRDLMRQAHEEQGSTAVDYTQDESTGRSQNNQLLAIVGEINTFSGGAGGALFKSAEKIQKSIDSYDKHLKEYDDLKNHKAAPSTIARKEQELARAFDELSDTLEHKKQPLFERNSFGTKESVNLNGRAVRESIPVSSCDDAQKLMKYTKFGRIAGPVFIMLDGGLRTKSVIDKYNANDPTWKREAVVQSAGFVGGIGMGVIIGGAIALTPVGLVAGLVIGGIAAVGADHFIKAGVEKVLGWFD
jgi:hypothetical protein